ncbi:MAG: hypothetical protein U0800_07955 [Isosphaeraceae bacterium]
MSLASVSQSIVDMTGPGAVAVGPDGILDFGIQISLPSQAAVYTATLTGPGSSPNHWQGGVSTFNNFFGYANPNGYWNAEMVPFTGGGGYTLYGSPSSDLSLATASLAVTYADANRAGKTDTAAVTMPTLSTTAYKTYPTVNSPTLTDATWGTQDTTNGLTRGNVHINLGTIPGHSTSDIDSAILTDEVGNVWVYRLAPNRPDYRFALNYSDGVFDFAPLVNPTHQPSGLRRLRESALDLPLQGRILRRRYALRPCPNWHGRPERHARYLGFPEQPGVSPIRRISKHFLARRHIQLYSTTATESVHHDQPGGRTPSSASHAHRDGKRLVYLPGGHRDQQEQHHAERLQDRPGDHPGHRSHSSARLAKPAMIFLGPTLPRPGRWRSRGASSFRRRRFMNCSACRSSTRRAASPRALGAGGLEHAHLPG